MSPLVLIASSGADTARNRWYAIISAQAIPHHPMKDKTLEAVHLAALLPLMLAALLLALSWARVPASYPIHWNAAGVPNGWVHRTPAAVFSPLLIAAAVVVVLWLALRYATPGNTRVRWILPALAWCSVAIGSITALLPLRPNAAALPVALLLVMPAIVLMICGIAVAAALRRPQSRAHGDGTPDSRWVAGIFYYNPQDPTLWVAKRFGIGWTLNFARPASWFMLGGILLVALAALVFSWFAHR